MKRIVRDRRLTPEEIAEDRRVRALVEREKPEISARIRQRMAVIRQERAAAAGSSTLGARIRAAREAQGLSQVELAAASGISTGA